MNHQLTRASPDEKIVIENLLQLYTYDFSEYVGCDVEMDGLFLPYPLLETYWREKNKFAYLVKVGGKYAGFALVKLIASDDGAYFSIAEFFVMKKYRRRGIGRSVAMQVFDLHKGEWEVYQKENNKPAQVFWNRIISEYTNGKFQERLERGRRIQRFQSTPQPSL
jgi:predicted acetyltransferase